MKQRPKSERTHTNNATRSVRRIKVYYACYQGSNYSHHPFIRIAGKYLREFGFKTGDTVELKLSQGRIEITKLDQE